METRRPEEKQPGLEMRPGDAWHTCVDASGVRAWEQLQGPGFLSEWILSVGAVRVPEGPRPLRCGQVGVWARRPSPGLSLSSFPGFAPFWAGLLLRRHVGAVAAPHAPGVRVRPERGLLPQAPKPKTRCVPGAPIRSHTTAPGQSPWPATCEALIGVGHVLHPWCQGRPLRVTWQMGESPNRSHGRWGEPCGAGSEPPPSLLHQCATSFWNVLPRCARGPRFIQGPPLTRSRSERPLLQAVSTAAPPNVSVPSLVFICPESPQHWRLIDCGLSFSDSFPGGRDCFISSQTSTQASAWRGVGTLSDLLTVMFVSGS